MLTASIERIERLCNNDQNLEEIRRLMAGLIVEMETSEEQVKQEIRRGLARALRNGCRYTQLDIVRYFVEERNLGVEWPDDKSSSTALHIASFCGSRTGREPVVVEFLLESAGSNSVDAQNRIGATALHYACAGGNMEVIELLVERGRADVNITDINGRPPVAVACRRDERILRYLIPRTTMTSLLFKALWRHDLPTDIMQLFVETYTRQQQEKVPLGEESRPSVSSWLNRFPVHAAFYAPLPSEEAILDYINCMGGETSLSHLSYDGRLPIHDAIASSANNGDASTPAVIGILVELEPRSAFVRDPITRFYPFEMAATTMNEYTQTCQGKQEEEPKNTSRSNHGNEILTLLYKLFRGNPELFLRSRGVGVDI